MQGIWSSSVAALCFRLSANFVHGNDREPELPVFRTSCDCLIPGGCPACQGDVRLGGKDWPTQAYQRDEPDAATLKARFEARFGDDAQPSAAQRDERKARVDCSRASAGFRAQLSARESSDLKLACSIP